MSDTLVFSRILCISMVFPEANADTQHDANSIKGHELKFVNASSNTIARARLSVDTRASAIVFEGTFAVFNSCSLMEFASGCVREFAVVFWLGWLVNLGGPFLSLKRGTILCNDFH